LLFANIAMEIVWVWRIKLGRSITQLSMWLTLQRLWIS